MCRRASVTRARLQVLRFVCVLTVIFSLFFVSAAEFRAPAAERYAQIGAGGTVLPGGRFLMPFGTQIDTGPGPFALALGPKGTITTADIGFERFGITIIDPPGRNPWRVHHIWARTPHSTAPEVADPDWKGVAAGIAFDSAKSLWVAEGRSGRIRQVDITTGDYRKIVNLNSPDWHDSFTGDLAYDGSRRLLYVVDQSNSRLAIIDTRTDHVLSSIKLEAEPFAIALSNDGSRTFVTEPNSICIVDVLSASSPKIIARIPAPSPQSVLVTADRAFVSNARDDSITVISTADSKVIAEIPLKIPSLEQFRGIIPAGMAYDPVTKWLLVAEAGINAVGVVDTATNQLIGHIPAGWMPTRVAISGDRVYVANAGGRGAGPNPRRAILELGEVPVLHRGSVTTFIMPDESEVLRQTGTVFSFNGLVPYMHDPPPPPAAIGNVVLIVKGNRTFDEVLGDLPSSALALPALARFGMHGGASGGRTQFSVQDAPITPNQHAIAQQWSFSDNFYALGDTRAGADVWLNGGYPDLIAETKILGSRDIPETHDFRDHLTRGGVTSVDFDFGTDTGTSDQARADHVLAEINRRYGNGREPFPQFLRIHLPNDRPGEPRPQDGYPYQASYVEDNDLATGRILQYLSHSPWWRTMAVFVTENDTEGSLDHVDSHRTLLLAAGPYIKRRHVSHTNTSFPGLLRTVYELLHLPPLNLMDKSAASPRDLFTEEPDYTPYTAVSPDPRIFDAGKLRPQE